MSAVLAIAVLILFGLGYRFYGAWVGRRVFDDRQDLETPAHRLADGVDYVATPRGILFGHHFTSVAGAAPILGPCIAAYWGVLPALVWIVLGTITMGAVHDFGALVVSVKEGGRSIADIAGSVLNHRVRTMFQVFILMMVWLVLAVFSMAIADLFVSQPGAVIPVNAGTLLALGMGWLLYKKRKRPFLPSVLCVVLLYGLVLVGTVIPVDLQQWWGWSAAEARLFWVLFLFAYAAIASLLPVWVLLQPRDYINSHQLLVGLGLLFVGMLVAHPPLEAPLVRVPNFFTFSEDAPPLFPTLFVTVACGAISGFHGLVSSGTTSKQLHHIRDARLVGYGSMVGEGMLAVIALLTAVAGLSLVGSGHLPAEGHVDVVGWSGYYQSWAHASTNKATAFVLGGGAFLTALGIPTHFAQTLIAVLVISFAATSLDTATRIQRLILEEIGQRRTQRRTQRTATASPSETQAGTKGHPNVRSTWSLRLGATFVAIAPAILIALAGKEDPLTGEVQSVGWSVWPIFGASNQMLAALTLLVLVLYTWQRKRPIWPLVLPMLIVMLATLVALVSQGIAFWHRDQRALAGVNALLLLLVTWMILETGLRARQRSGGQ